MRVQGFVQRVQLARGVRASAILLLLAVPAFLAAQSPAQRRTSAYLDSIRASDALLTAFVRAMPKGGDLHNHLSGAIYAESMIGWASEAGLCVVVDTRALQRPPCNDSVAPPVSQALTDDALYGAIIDTWSMRNWDRSRRNGHDHFFETFGKFDLATVGRMGDMLAEVAERAAAGGVSYLELMATPALAPVLQAAGSAQFTEDYGVLRDRLLAAGLPQGVAAVRAELDRAEAKRDSLLACGTPTARPGCTVTIRYLYQVLRAFQPVQVYAQILTGYLLQQNDPRVVGINLVQPEDDYVAMRDFRMHMWMMHWLNGAYPSSKVTLHAGELVPGLVPPEGLRFHIGESVEVAGARRIGHGVDVLNEDRPFDLLRDLAEKRIMIEICLTSNDVILDVQGTEHPLHTYLRFGVPVALATDDEGVSRSEMSLEYFRAVRDQKLDYATLKQMARNSLTYAFVEGEGIWSDTARAAPVPVCRDIDAVSCRALGERSIKARLQRELELAFRRFEQSGGRSR